MLSRDNDIIDVYLTVAKNIKKYRRRNKMTQKDLAIVSGYSYAYIRRLESSKCNKNFSIKTLYNLSKVLNVDIKELFKRDNI